MGQLHTTEALPSGNVRQVTMFVAFLLLVPADKSSKLTSPRVKQTFTCGQAELTVAK